MLIPPQHERLFLPYQRRWIEDRSPLKIMEKSRQIGLSWAAAYGLVRQQAVATAAADSWVSSRDELQAELFIADCSRFADILHTAARRYDRALLDGDRPLLARTLRFASGGQIHCLSSSPNAQAGKRGTRLLDEFALHPNPRELYTIALPGITWGGSLEIISTHRGAGNFFNQLLIEIRQRGNPKNFSLHRVTLEDALADGFLPRLKQKLPADDPRQKMTESNYIDYIRSQCADEAAFRQEYMCDPMGDESSFLPLSLIMAAESDAALPEAPAGPLFVGVDLGRTSDFTVIYILERIGDQLFTRHILPLHNTPFAEQEAHLRIWADHPLCRGVAIDASGLGRQFAERAQERYGRHRVHTVIFTEESKARLAYQLKDAFERRSLRLPVSPQLREDLTSVQRAHSSSGALRFWAPRSSSGHADHFWALALAVDAACAHSPSSSPGLIHIPSRRTPSLF
jgi:phage FluMu gp28-like protein